MKTATDTGSTFDFTINVGVGLRAHVDSYAGGPPFLIISDGMTEVTFRPRDDTITASTIAFAEELADKARAYATCLRAPT